jgi:hypothetical protein
VLTAGLLAKMPAAALLVFLIPILLDRGASEFRRVLVGTGAILAVGIMSWWYFHWVPALLEKGAFQLYWPKSLPEGWREIAARPGDTLRRFTFTSFYSYTAFLCLAAGIWGLRAQRRFIQLMMSAALMVLLVYMLKTGECIPEHDYYLIPFVPVMAVLAAIGLRGAEQWPRIQNLVMAVIMLEGIINQQHDFRWPENMAYKLELSEDLGRLLPAEEPIAVISDLNPADLYFANRPGWLIDTLQMNDPLAWERLRKAGCRHIAVNAQRPWLSGVKPELTEVPGTQYWRLFALPEE